MVLVSPGVQVTVVDESQYASTGPGTIPLILIATASNKLIPDGTAIATGTILSNAGKMELITSQRDLVQKFGAPVFEKKDGSVVQGSEVSEYGLFAAYSYLGIANRAYVIRADVDLNQLKFNQSAPTSAPNNGTYWFDIESTSFGVFRANGNVTPGLAWDAVTVLLPTASNLTVGDVPDAGYGVDGDIAVVTQTTSNVVYEKIVGAWYAVGSNAWKAARPTVVLGTVVNPTVTIADDIVINGETVTFTGTTLASVISDINGNVVLSGLGISAGNNANRLEITDATGGDLTISGTGVADLGVASTVGYKLTYSTHVAIPNGTKSGNIWVKTTDPNFGASYSVKRFDSALNQFQSVTAPLYMSDASADTAYGAAKTIGSLYVQYNTLGTLPSPIASHTIKRWSGSAWTVLVYEAGTSAPTNDPEEGTMWISDDFKVDVMVNDGNEWKGYLNQYPATDPLGVQITSAQPTEQTDGSPLVDNDLWLDSADLDNYPALYRWNATTLKWVLIDKTDQTTPFGVVFADARNNDTGDQTGSEVITDMLVSDYVDAGTPNPETYPAGILLFNTRYSTYNVKEWMPDFYADQDAYTVGAASFPALS